MHPCRCFRKSCVAIGLFLLLLLGTTNQAHCRDNEIIVKWVAAKLRVGNNYAMPKINFVDRTQLGCLFTAGSKGLMTRWAAHQGQDDAEKLMKLYLESVAGLFDPKTQTIYVGKFLSPCRQKAILAHEATHFFQNIVRGPIRGAGMAAEMMLMQRELEASAIEAEYEDQFCTDGILATHSLFNVFFP
jgi:hypothetical protein